jgi:hypothetical protein
MKFVWPFRATRTCQPVENYYSRRMAKMATAQTGRADLPVSQDAQQRVPTMKLKSSPFLDARVLKPTGSFYYHCDWQ